MKIIVTGGAGFIGSHLVDRLVQAGHKVWTLDNLSTGSTAFLPNGRFQYNHTLIQGCVTDRALLEKLMENCDVVFHLAAMLGVKNTVENPIQIIESNIDGTRTVLETAYKKQVKVIFSSTSEIYGKNQTMPFRENSDRVLGATSIHRWCYSTAKALDEHLCFAYAEKGLPVTILRYFNAYGPRQSSSQYGQVVPRFITAALQNKPIEVYGEGTQSRCFTFIDDTVSGTVSAMRSKANGLAINIGSNESITIYELAQLILKTVDSSSPIVKIPYDQVYGRGYEDLPARIPDLSLCRSILDYQPSVSLRDGLQRTIDWYRENLQ